MYYVEPEIPWSGKPLAGKDLAFDTETTMVDLDTTVPDLVCLSASDGERAVVVFPHQLFGFFVTHNHVQRWAAWNLGFDYWVLYKAGRQMVGALEDGRFGDTMILDQLVALAEGRPCFKRSLKKAAKDFLGIELEKDDDIRTGFTVEMARDWNNPSYRKSWEYAAQDALVTWYLDRELRERAGKLVGALPFSTHDQADKWGLLTEQIQVRAAVALAQITRNGVGTDQAKVVALAKEARTTANDAIARLTATCPDLIKKFKRAPRAGVAKVSGSGLPQLNTAQLSKVLERLAEENGLNPPRTEKTKKPTVASEWWETEFPDNGFVQAWSSYQGAAKVLQQCQHLEGRDRVHAKYNVLVRTGRTSARDPNIQNQDRQHRDLFVAPPGFVLGAFDYGAIELCTLASIHQERLGRSTLGNVIRSGVDPHRYTASLLRGTNPRQAVSKADRQAAKALNFGIPGGLGAKKLKLYAKTTYGVDFTAEEAYQFRQKIITEVYPEWGEWLKDGLAVRLSYSLGCTRREAEDVLGVDSEYMDPMEHPAVRVWAGCDTRKDSEEKFASFYKDQVWTALDSLCGDEHAPLWVLARVSNREPGVDLAGYLVNVPCVTLTGRVRANAFYSEWRNTQFQGLAADGAKLALWELVREGFKVVAFVHDEVVVELPERTAEDDARRIVPIMSNAFSRVCPGVPIRVEYALGRTWTKP